MAPLVVIVGETASGKSKLAMELAKKFNGEIICADSRTVYKGMDIGTAKPSQEEQVQIPHHLLDLIQPDERFTAADFKELSNKAIQDIYNRGKLPIMVGGTGLYIDSVIYDYNFASSEQPPERDPLNPRHLLKGDEKQALQLRPKTLVISPEIDNEVLKERIANRLESMLKQGLPTEVKSLADKYGWESAAMLGIGYREWQNYFSGQADLTETKQQITKDTRDYAKRQRTWFKRNKSIHYISKLEEAVDLVTTFLNK